MTSIQSDTPQVKPSSIATAAAAQVGTPTASSRLLLLALGFAVAVLATAVAMGFRETPEVKMTFFKWAVSSAASVLSAGLLASGYSVGKLFEGVTPAGFLPLAGKLIAGVAEMRVSPRVDVAALQPFSTLGAPLSDHPDAPRLDPAASNRPADWVAVSALQSGTAGAAAAASKAAPLIVLALLCISAVGCVGTSAQFQQTIGAGVDNVVLDMRDYTAAHDWDSNHNGIVDAGELAAKSGEVALTDALAASVADKKAITVDGVDAAWKPVESVWRRYLAGDPLLTGDAQSLKIRSDTGDLINKLIQAENERQAALRATLGLFGGTK